MPRGDRRRNAGSQCRGMIRRGTGATALDRVPVAATGQPTVPVAGIGLRQGDRHSTGPVIVTVLGGTAADRALAVLHMDLALHIEAAMRTSVEIDDELMRQAMRASGARTKRATVELGLRMLVSVGGQQSIRRLRGNVKWTGDLDAGRLGRVRSGR